MEKVLLYNASIVNEGRCFFGYIIIEGEFISEINEGLPSQSILNEVDRKYNLEGLLILPGVIDDQVHFREPGLTHKGDIESESKCAVAGGITSFMDMPNTKPPTTSLEAWNKKMEIARKNSYANYSFFVGATNDNLDFLKSIDSSYIPGIKVFLGSSTGNMLVDNEQTLDSIFSLPNLIAIHSEDEEIINRNKEIFKKKYPGGIPVKCHPEIRSSEACYESTKKAVIRAKRLNTRLHILHLSTSKELEFLSDNNISDKKITAEVCVHHLWFDDTNYDKFGSLIKWNPAVKTISDKENLRKALKEGKIDIVATDHAPHLLQEKQGDALSAASGGPLIQHSLLAMLDLAKDNIFSYEEVVKYMCHNPALLYNIAKRGFLRKGYYADLVVVNPNQNFHVTESNILSKCGWSPFKDSTFRHNIYMTFVNGKIVYDNSATNDDCSIGTFSEEKAAMPLRFQSPI